MPSLTPVEHDPFEDDVYDDTQTFEQGMQRREQYLKDLEAAKRGSAATITPPEMETGGAQLPMRVISPDAAADRAFHPSDYLPPVYGAGRYRMFTPTQGLASEVFQRSLGKKLMEMMNPDASR